MAVCATGFASTWSTPGRRDNTASATFFELAHCSPETSSIAVDCLPAIALPGRWPLYPSSPASRPLKYTLRGYAEPRHRHLGRPRVCAVEDPLDRLLACRHVGHGLCEAVAATAAACRRHHYFAERAGHAPTGGQPFLRQTIDHRGPRNARSRLCARDAAGGPHRSPAHSRWCAESRTRCWQCQLLLARLRRSPPRKCAVLPAGLDTPDAVLAAGSARGMPPNVVSRPSTDSRCRSLEQSTSVAISCGALSSPDVRMHTAP